MFSLSDTWTTSSQPLGSRILLRFYVVLFCFNSGLIDLRQSLGIRYSYFLFARQRDRAPFYWLTPRCPTTAHQAKFLLHEIYLTSPPVFQCAPKLRTNDFNYRSVFSRFSVLQLHLFCTSSNNLPNDQIWLCRSLSKNAVSFPCRNDGGFQGWPKLSRKECHLCQIGDICHEARKEGAPGVAIPNMQKKASFNMM